jgi:hypothetical protein
MTWLYVKSLLYVPRLKDPRNVCGTLLESRDG